MKIIFSYTKNETIIIRRCLSPAGDVVIPAYIGGIAVTELAPYAFSRSELVTYDGCFIYDTEEDIIYECSAEAGENLDKSEEVICERLTSVSLPETLLKVGRYVFYNCDRLSSVRMFSTTTDLGFGMFTGCRGVRNIDMTVAEDRRSSLNDVLVNIRYPVKLVYRESLPEDAKLSASEPSPDNSDMSGDLLPECTNAGIGSLRKGKSSSLLQNEPGTVSDVRKDYPVKYRLIFPEYYENSKENTPARITVRDMQGSGYMYRNCFANTKFQIKRYDSLFPYAEALESEETVCELALCRLETPEALSEEAKERYASYLKFHAKKLTELLSGHYESGEITLSVLRNIAGMDFVTEDYLSKMSSAASELKKPDVLSVLMDVRHEKFRSEASEKSPEKGSPRKKRFSL